jgi:hypothetical protein
MNSLHLFYKEKITKLIQSQIQNEVQKNITIKSPFNEQEINEENICPICEDKKVTMMINCLVKYFILFYFNLLFIKKSIFFVKIVSILG